MSQWGGDGPPLVSPSDSPDQTLPNDISFIILSLAMITQQLSALLASQVSSLSSASPSVSTWLLQALTNISTTTYYLSFAHTSTVTSQQSSHSNSHSLSAAPTALLSS